MSEVEALFLAIQIPRGSPILIFIVKVDNFIINCARHQEQWVIFFTIIDICRWTVNTSDAFQPSGIVGII